MLKTWFKRGVIAATLAALVALFAWLLWPVPVAVDVARAQRGPMETTINEEGINRIRHVYVVSAPATGKLLRPGVETGDQVVAGQTVVATIAAVDPTMLDARTQRELTAAAEGARDAREVAELQVAKAEREQIFARSELKKAQELAGKRGLSLSLLDQKLFEEDVSEKALLAARAQLKMREHELELALARLESSSEDNTEVSSCCFSIRAPVTGTILVKLAESERVIQAGAPIMEIGNPRESEIAVDLLSTDAVSLKPGTPARIKEWGGTETLPARVTKVEPSAFTKISALGIEEQRVKVLLSLTNTTVQLGHQFRVVAEIVTWGSNDALQIPISALVRKGDSWAIHRVVDGKSSLAEIKIGHMNEKTAEVLAGISDKDVVVVHPSDFVADQVRVEEREVVETPIGRTSAP